YRVQISGSWSAGDQAAMLALHARRSALSVQAWRAAHPNRPLAVVLTGTDLYDDIGHDAQAQQSLELADRLVVLQPLGVRVLPTRLQHKAVVCIQSSRARQTAPKTSRHLRALMVGHLRAVKSPETWFDTARALRHRSDILLDHIGDALDPALGDAARRCMADCPNYRWLGALPHAATRRRIQQAHVLVHASRMEGGAHVVIEAVTSGTPVLASRIDGNLGLLGEGYSGVFDCGDSTTVATLLQRCRDDPAMLPTLAAQCALRAPLFTPAHEQGTLLTLMRSMLEARR
ncbi:MAG: selenoneine biosynthesis selenosugar synthase SenB, partial [Aquabacterium sp.]